MKLKNSNCDETQKLKWWQNSKLKLWQNSKTQSVTKLKLLPNSNCECRKTQDKNVTKLKL